MIDKIIKMIRTVLNAKYSSYAHSPMVWGVEHLFGLHNKIMASAPVKILFSGDSTTAGVGLSSDKFMIDRLLMAGAAQDGFYGISAVNSGHSGAHTGEWDSTYVSQDIELTPDVFVIRWGVNDPYYGRNLEQFTASLRSGLNKIRIAHPLSSGVGVVLMVPNSTNDTPNGRDEIWYEQVTDICRIAAADFNCAFIDTYGLFQNSEEAANKWMDDPFGDGRAIHPKDVMNLSISSVLYDLIFPSMIRVFYKNPVERTPTLENGWVNYDPTTKEATYYKDGNMRVHLSGIIKNGAITGGTTLFTLPAEFRPRSQEFFQVLSSGAIPASIYIQADGQVKIFSGIDSAYLSLSGISFVAKL